MNKVEADERRLTDYALGELDAPAAEELEQLLQRPENADARDAVEEIRRVAALLSTAYREEVARTPDLGQARLERLAGSRGPAKGRWWSRRLVLAWSAAAVVVAGAGLLGYGYLERERSAPRTDNLAGGEGDIEQAVPGGMYSHKNLKSFGLATAADTGAALNTRPRDAAMNTESYDYVRGNDFLEVVHNPLSTFSIDVDSASYANVRRFLRSGCLPPAGAVRIEEMINYFDYRYPQPSGDRPFSVTADVAEAPWNPGHRLARIGIKGREIPWDERSPGNLVFLIDVSGSMESPNKLPLLKKALRLLLERLDERDRVAMVVYAGASGLVLDSTPGNEQGKILAALERLRAGGSTHGSAGIRLAYEVAARNLIRGGNNRVILATDGDFNVGVTDQGSLVRLIERQAAGGVFLTVLGFGMGNYKDSTLEKLADHGNGNYAYIDSLREARKVLVRQAGGTMMTIAKDVKIQVEFNPARVQAYRLIGYENRLLAAEDFNDDTKDAGEIGSGHTVTALYEVVPVGVRFHGRGVDPLKYQRPARAAAPAEGSDEIMTVKIRYQEPDGGTSRLIERPVVDSGGSLRSADPDFRFAAAVAAFGMLLRDSQFKGKATFGLVEDLAASARGRDPHGYRAEFEELVERAASLWRQRR